MIYTIDFTKDLATEQEVSLVKSGNKYYVELYDKEGKKYAKRDFDNKEDAHDRFLLITQYFLDCWGSFEFRKNKLLEEVMEEDKRTCTECGKEMHEGYCIENGIEYYCSDNCLHKNISEEEYLKLYDDGNGDSYWTVWEED